MNHIDHLLSVLANNRRAVVEVLSEEKAAGISWKTEGVNVHRRKREMRKQATILKKKLRSIASRRRRKGDDSSDSDESAADSIDTKDPPLDGMRSLKI